MDQQNTKEKQFPDNLVPLGKTAFSFACHPGVDCFNSCCRKLDMYLYPYDIVRLKNRIGAGSGDFLRRYTRIGRSSHPYFPAVMMKMEVNSEMTCPFLTAHGCSVYEDRPTACRTYPLERAVDRTSMGGRPEEFYFITGHQYCHGHQENRQWTVKEWLRDQHLFDYNFMNDLWSEVDTVFSKNPWQGEGAAGPKQQMAFMVCYNLDGFSCYNLDGFRKFVNDHSLLSQFKLDKGRAREIDSEDEALLKFGFDWLKYVLSGQPTLVSKR